MDKVLVEMTQENINAIVKQPDVVVLFEVAEDSHIRVSITPEGELYLNADWCTIFIRPDSANTCFVTALPLGTHLKSKASRIMETDE